MAHGTGGGGPEHDDWCFREQHTDQSLPCSSNPIRIHGLTAWVTRGERGIEAEVHWSGRLTNAQLAEVIARLAEIEGLVG